MVQYFEKAPPGDAAWAGLCSGTHPAPSPDGHVVSGHVHPAVPLHGPGRRRLRLAAFVVIETITTLPAAGAFTGSATCRPPAAAQIYVVAEADVINM